MSDLEPITRAENFWVNEGDLEPITRKEQYIKHLYDETQVVPEYPKTREEYFINKAGEELHDVTIERLTVTENGTYSESGKAYSPVIVDVPLPENAYLLKDIANTPSPIATFTDGSALPMPKLEVAVEPQQSGSGDPSPTNIRPISGWSAVDVTVADDVDNPTTTKTITIQLGDTYYGGKLDVVNGVLTVNKLGINVMSQEKRGWQIGSKSVCYRITLPQTATSCTSNQTHGAISNMMTEQLAYYGVSRPNDLDSINFAIDTSGVALAVYDTDLTLSEQQMISKYTDLFAVYPLATPLTYQLTPTAVKSLLGTNNLWANTGDVVDGQYFSKEV